MDARCADGTGDQDPCTRCGACCASYRVSFYWADPHAGALPDALLEQVTPHLACMRGTNARRPRCVALDGIVGQSVRCTVYDLRPDACRAVMPGDERCNRARARHGLEPVPARGPSRAPSPGTPHP